MPKPIALFDIDNTIYDGFSYFGFLEKQVAENLIKQPVLDEARASLKRHKSQLQDYETTIIELLDIYAAGLKGVAYEAILQSTKEFYAHSDKFYDYVRPAMHTLQSSHDISLVTGEPQFVAQAVGELFGVQSYYSTQYEVADGLFTGKITSYLASRHEKHDAIKHLMEGHGVSKSFAFGDSEGDIEMLRAVQFPICINPTDGLQSIAAKEGWHMPDILEVTDLVDELIAMKDAS